MKLYWQMGELLTFTSQTLHILPDYNRNLYMYLKICILAFKKFNAECRINYLLLVQPAPYLCDWLLKIKVHKTCFCKFTGKIFTHHFHIIFKWLSRKWRKYILWHDIHATRTFVFISCVNFTFKPCLVNSIRRSIRRI